MKILAVCGLGQGTSLLLKMNIEDVLRELGVQADVDYMDASAAKSEAADIIMASPQLVPLLEEHSAAVISLDSYLDKDEIKQKLSEHLGK